MLQAMKEKMSGGLTYTIIAGISVVFALWGVESIFESSSSDDGPPMANVGNVTVYEKQFNNAYYQTSQKMTDNDENFDNKQLEHQVFLKLIEESLQENFANTLNITIPDSLSENAMNQQIAETKEFFVKGVFNEKLFKQTLKSNGLSMSYLVDEMSRQVSQNQLSVGILGSDFVLPFEIINFTNLQNQIRKIKYVTLSKSDIDNKFSNISQDDIEKYYNKNSSKFMTDTELQLSYIDLNMNDRKANIKISNEKLKSYYEKHKTELFKAKSFGSSKNKIKSTLINIQAEQEYLKIGSELEQLSFENPHSLKFVANELNLKIHKTKTFNPKSTDLTGILSNKDVIKTALSANVITDKYNSDIINLSNSRAIIIRVNKYIKPTKKPLSDVSNEIENILRKNYIKAEINKQSKKLVKNLNTNKKVEKLKWKTEKVSLADTGDFDYNDIIEIFSKKISTNKKANYFIQNKDDNLIIMAVIEIINNKKKLNDEENKVNEYLYTAMNQQYLKKNYLQYLESNTDIKIYSDK